jgi:hypothetical protein
VLPGVVVDDGEVVLLDEELLDGVLDGELLGEDVCAKAAVENNNPNAKIFNFIVFMMLGFLVIDLRHLLL